MNGVSQPTNQFLQQAQSQQFFLIVVLIFDILYYSIMDIYTHLVTFVAVLCKSPKKLCDNEKFVYFLCQTNGTLIVKTLCLHAKALKQTITAQLVKTNDSAYLDGNVCENCLW